MKRKRNDTLAERLHLQIRKNPLKHFKKALENNQVDIVKFILSERLVDPSGDDDNWLLGWASYFGHEEVVKLLLSDARVDPSAENNRAIINASENGHEKVVKLLLNDQRVDPSACGNDAIGWASHNGHEKVVRLLLNDSRVDPSDDVNYAIIYASRNGHEKVVTLLLTDPRVNSSADNNYAIRKASVKGHENIVKHLLGHSWKLQDRTKIAPNILDIVDTWTFRPDTLLYFFSNQMRSEFFTFLLCVKKRQWYRIVKKLRFLIGTYLLDRRTPKINP